MHACFTYHNMHRTDKSKPILLAILSKQYFYAIPTYVAYILHVCMHVCICSFVRMYLCI